MRMKQLWQDWGTLWFLEQYGLWTNGPSGLRLGYPKMTNFAKMQPRNTVDIEIDDEVGGFIHDCINEMGQRLPVYKNIIIEYYVKNRSMKDAGLYAGGLKRAKAIETIRSAEAWLDCKLNDYFKMTEAQRLVYTLKLDKVA